MARLLPFLSAYRYTLLSAGLVVVLILPPVLRSVDRSWEPFPAVLLSGGGSVVSTHRDSVDTQVLRAYGYRSKDTVLVPIPPDSLLHPVPGRYLSYLFHRGALGPTDDPAARRERRDWLAPRLNRLGLKDTRMLLRSESLRMPDRGRDTVVATVVSEWWLELD